jgi:hypothetical protein
MAKPRLQQGAPTNTFNLTPMAQAAPTVKEKWKIVVAES